MLSDSEHGFVDLCRTAYQIGDFSACKPLGFDLVGWVAIATPLVLIAAWLIRKFLRRRADTTHLRIPWRPWRRRFNALCTSIQPLMKENGRWFHEFGPNSGIGDGVPKIVRYDVSIWKQIIPKVVLNNSHIRALVQANYRSIPSVHRRLFNNLIDHIDAFEAHSLDDATDYRDHQFPLPIVDVINRHA